MKRPGPTESCSAKRTQYDPDPRLLPLKQAAKWLGLSAWALRERIWAGQIPVIRFPGGRKQYRDVKDLEEFVRKNKTTIT